MIERFFLYGKKGDYLETTKNYALNRPAQDDFYDVDDFNENMDIIDEELYALENPVYEDAKTLETLKSGEKIVTAFGKIAKSITDFISHISDEVVHITADERMKWNAKQDASTAITTENIGNQSVKHATTADTATAAGNADTVDGHHFNWSGQSGQPGWLWGGNDATNMYVYNPSNFSVNYAKSAGSATDQTARNSAANANNNANGRLSTRGGTITGDIDMSGHGIGSVRAIYGNGNEDARIMTNSTCQVLSKDWSTTMNARCNSLVYTGSLTKESYRGAKENIRTMGETQARKILKVPVRVFDYRPGFGNNQKDLPGEIVDEVADIIPESVVIPEDWNEEEFNELLGSVGNEQIPGIDQTKFIPYLIALVQLQQKQIENLEQKVTALENKN